MAPTKTTKKNASSKKVTKTKEKEKAASTAALQAATKKNAPSKSKKAASTAALQAAKKKNQLRKGSGLGMSYPELNDSSTTMPRHLLLNPESRTALVNTNTPPEASGAGGDSTTAAISLADEIEQLKGQLLLLSCSVHGNSHMELAAEVLLLLSEKENTASHALAQRAEITAIPKPRGEAGSKGFKLIKEMGLDDTAEHKQLYRSIMVRQRAVNNWIVTHFCYFLFQRSVRNSIIKRSIDLTLDFRKVDPDDLSAIFKSVSTKTFLFVFLLTEML
jgi:hypothetical protein